MAAGSNETPPTACGLCGEDGEIHFSEQLDAWCCLSCYETRLGPAPATDRQLAYVNRLSGVSHDYSIACDKYKEARWNITAVANTVHSLRQMERDGTSRLLERAMEGFKEQLPQNIPAREAAHG